jgi:hypothetical protein
MPQLSLSEWEEEKNKLLADLKTPQPKLNLNISYSK